MSQLISIPARAYHALARKAGVAPLYASRQHAKQIEFRRDKSRKRTMLCGRRGGKSRAIACALVEKAESLPGERSVYITLTRSRSRQILWDGALERMRREMGLDYELKTRDGQLMVEFPNRSSIWLAGCADKTEIDKFRGERFAMAAIDEAMAFPEWLKELIEAALWPALGDLGAPLILAGTCSPVAVGYFYEATMGMQPGYSRHKFDCRDNPYLENPEQMWADALEMFGGEESPTFKREWLAEWANDPNALIYPIVWETNSWTPEGERPYGLPEGEYRYGLGVDIGFGEGSTAFVFGACRRGTGEVYILKGWKRSRLVPTALAAHVGAFREKHQNLTGGQGLTIVVDEGALGKGYAQQMRDLGVQCEAAEKAHKRAYQDYVRGLILNGSMKVHFGQCGELLDETRKLQFDAVTGLEDESYLRHCADACLYLARKLFPRYDPKKVPPAPGSVEYFEAQMAREKEREAQELQKQARKRRI